MPSPTPEIPQAAPFPLDFSHVDPHAIAERLHIMMEERTSGDNVNPLVSQLPDHNNWSAKLQGLDHRYQHDDVVRVLTLAQYDIDPAVPQDAYDLFTPTLLADLCVHNPAVMQWLNQSGAIITQAVNVQEGRDARARLWAQGQQVLERVLPLIPRELFTEYCVTHNLPQPTDESNFRQIFDHYIAHSDYRSDVLGEMIGQALQEALKVPETEMESVSHTPLLLPMVIDHNIQDEKALQAARAKIDAARSSGGEQKIDASSTKFGNDSGIFKELEQKREAFYQNQRDTKARLGYESARDEIAHTWLGAHADTLSQLQTIFIQLQSEQNPLLEQMMPNDMESLPAILDDLTSSQNKERPVELMYRFISRAHELAYYSGGEPRLQIFKTFYDEIVPLYEKLRDCQVIDESDLMDKSMKDVRDKVYIFPDELLEQVKDDEKVVRVRSIGASEEKPAPRMSKAQVEVEVPILELRTRQPPSEFLQNVPIRCQGIVSPGEQIKYIDDFYTLLGLPPNATEKEIQRTIKRGVRVRYHPDSHPYSEEDLSRIGEINQFLTDIETILTDPAKRAQYDVLLNGITNGGTSSRSQFSGVWAGDGEKIDYSFLTRNQSRTDAEGSSGPSSPEPPPPSPQPEPPPPGPETETHPEVERAAPITSYGKTSKGGRDLNMDRIWVDGQGISGNESAVDSRFVITEEGKSNLITEQYALGKLKSVQDKGLVGAVNIVADGVGSIEGSEKASNAFATLFPYMLAKNLNEYPDEQFKDTLEFAFTHTQDALEQNCSDVYTNMAATVVDKEGNTWVISVGDADIFVENERGDISLVSENQFHKDLCQKGDDFLHSFYDNDRAHTITDLREMLDQSENSQMNVSLTTHAASNDPTLLHIAKLDGQPTLAFLCTDGVSKATGLLRKDTIDDIFNKYESLFNTDDANRKWEVWKRARADLFTEILKVRGATQELSHDRVVNRVVNTAVGNSSGDNISLIVTGIAPSERGFDQTVRLEGGNGPDLEEATTMNYGDANVVIHNLDNVLLQNLQLGDGAFVVCESDGWNTKSPNGQEILGRLDRGGVDDPVKVAIVQADVTDLSITEFQPEFAAFNPDHIMAEAIQTTACMKYLNKDRKFDKVSVIPVDTRMGRQFLIAKVIQPKSQSMFGSMLKKRNIIPYGLWDGVNPADIIIDGTHVRVGAEKKKTIGQSIRSMFSGVVKRKKT